MKINYKILWLDDQIETFIEDEHVEEIEKFLDEEGFEVTVDTVDNQEDFFKKLNDSYDLILTDYHMDTMNGDKVVEEIRNQSIFTEILFYTARADLKDTQMLDRISFLETNSSQADHEEAVVEKTKQLIQLTIKKFHDIVVMRGMIMHETSSLDTKKLELLNSFVSKAKYNKYIENLQNDLFDNVIQDIDQKLKNIEKYKKNKNLNQLMKDNVLFSSSKKILAMSKILDILSEVNFADEYNKEIIQIRNKFAHAELLVDENGRKYFKYKEDGLDFNNDFCKDIRKNIIKHKKNLNKLETKLNE